MKYSFDIECYCDGWAITMLDDTKDPPKKIESYYWDHNDSELGVGGEKIFADILEKLGYTVKCEDAY